MYLSDILHFCYRGPSLITYLDTMPSFNRSLNQPVRMPIVDRYKVSRQECVFPKEATVKKILIRSQEGLHSSACCFYLHSFWSCIEIWGVFSRAGARQNSLYLQHKFCKHPLCRTCLRSSNVCIFLRPKSTSDLHFNNNHLCTECKKILLAHTCLYWWLLR